MSQDNRNGNKRRSKPTKSLGLGSRNAVKFEIGGDVAQSLSAMVTATLDKGAAIMFSRSRDGFALGIRVYHDDLKPETAWIADEDDFDEFATKLKGFLDGLDRD